MTHHDSDPRDLHDDDDADLHTQLALLKFEMRLIRGTMRTVAAAVWGLVVVGAIALMTIGAYKERVDTLGPHVDRLETRVSRIEARPYLANTHRSDSP
jgi:hypothetical protein